MMKKGFAPIIIIIGLVLILSLIGGAYYIRNIRNSQRSSTSEAIPSNNTKSSPVVATSQPAKDTSRPEGFTLLAAWQELTTYTNPQLSISFKYPKSFLVTTNDTTSYASNLRPSVSVTFATPEVPIERRQKQGFDWNSYDSNTMRVNVYQYDNPNKLSVYDFIAQINKTYAGNGIQETYETYKKYLKQTAIPKQGSYVFEGNKGENPTKEVYFESNGKIYLFVLSGGNNTGEGYSDDGNKLFENILGSINFQ